MKLIKIYVINVKIKIYQINKKYIFFAIIKILI